MGVRSTSTHKSTFSDLVLQVGIQFLRERLEIEKDFKYYKMWGIEPPTNIFSSKLNTDEQFRLSSSMDLVDMRKMTA